MNRRRGFNYRFGVAQLTLASARSAASVAFRPAALLSTRVYYTVAVFRVCIVVVLKDTRFPSLAANNTRTTKEQRHNNNNNNMVSILSCIQYIIII